MEAKISLDKASVMDADDVLDMLREIPVLETGFENAACNLRKNEFGEFLSKTVRLSEEPASISGQVRTTTYWLRINGYPVGTSRLFHLHNFRIIDEIVDNAGLVSYSIRPSQRNKKCGILIAKETLRKAAEFGYKKVLMVCAETNIASRKCIEHNGGQWQRTHDGQCHYWVSLADRRLARPD